MNIGSFVLTGNDGLILSDDGEGKIDRQAEQTRTSDVSEENRTFGTRHITPCFAIRWETVFGVYLCLWWFWRFSVVIIVFDMVDEVMCWLRVMKTMVLGFQ